MGRDWLKKLYEALLTAQKSIKAENDPELDELDHLIYEMIKEINFAGLVYW